MITVFPGIYQNYKGNFYRVIGIGKHTETDEDVVVYKSIEENDNRLWCRPLSMFIENVTVEGELFPRFRFLSQSQVLL